MRFSLLIKGSENQAINYLEQRGMEYIKTRAMHKNEQGNYTTCTLIVGAKENDVINWFCEEPRQAPYPIGALLCYRYED